MSHCLENEVVKINDFLTKLHKTQKQSNLDVVDNKLKIYFFNF